MRHGRDSVDPVRCRGRAVGTYLTQNAYPIELYARDLAAISREWPRGMCRTAKAA